MLFFHHLGGNRISSSAVIQISNGGIQIRFTTFEYIMCYIIKEESMITLLKCIHYPFNHAEIFMLVFILPQFTLYGICRHLLSPAGFIAFCKVIEEVDIIYFFFRLRDEFNIVIERFTKITYWLKVVTATLPFKKALFNQ